MQRETFLSLGFAFRSSTESSESLARRVATEQLLCLAPQYKQCSTGSGTTLEGRALQFDAIVSTLTGTIMNSLEFDRKSSLLCKYTWDLAQKYWIVRLAQKAEA